MSAGNVDFRDLETGVLVHMMICIGSKETFGVTDELIKYNQLIKEISRRLPAPAKENDNA